MEFEWTTNIRHVKNLQYSFQGQALLCLDDVPSLFSFFPWGFSFPKRSINLCSLRVFFYQCNYGPIPNKFKEISHIKHSMLLILNFMGFVEGCKMEVSCYVFGTCNMIIWDLWLYMLSFSPWCKICVINLIGYLTYFLAS